MQRPSFWDQDVRCGEDLLLTMSWTFFFIARRAVGIWPLWSSRLELPVWPPPRRRWVDVGLVAFPAGSTSFLQAELKEADEDGNLEEEELVDEERCQKVMEVGGMKLS